MATLHKCSSEDSVAVTGRVEPGLVRLPLELRQHIYAIIFDSPRFVDLRYVSVVLAYSRDMVYRPKLAKLREMSKRWFGSDDSKHDEVVDSGLEEYFEKKLSESDSKDAFLLENVMYEWRTGILEVSNAISYEALDVLYGQNVFVVDVHGRGYRGFLKFGVANLRRVRYLHIVARPMGISYGKPIIFDPQLWLPLLRGCCSSVLWRSSHWRLEATTVPQLLMRFARMDNLAGPHTKVLQHKPIKDNSR